MPDDRDERVEGERAEVLRRQAEYDASFYAVRRRVQDPAFMQWLRQRVKSLDARLS